jgi:small subunit ribosomal protein S2
VIPGNDDALRAIRLFTSRIADAVSEGRGIRESAAADQVASGGGEPQAEPSGRRQPGSAVARQRREPAATTPASV